MEYLFETMRFILKHITLNQRITPTETFHTYFTTFQTDAPRRITETTRRIKQIPDNQTLSGISFFWQVAENSRFKHIIGG